MKTSKLLPKASTNLVNAKLITAECKIFWIIRLTEKSVKWVNQA